MTNESDFTRLNEHLQQVHPIVREFCIRHGFSEAPRLAIGRYPRIRIERSGPIDLWFDLWMELDDDGRRFEEFSRELPYELSAGACIVMQDGPAQRSRLQKSIVCFSGKPFYQVGDVLLEEMEKNLRIVEAWDTQYLQNNGIKAHLRS